jgi:tetratricopeptide (TPR) repeat protein
VAPSIIEKYELILAADPRSRVFVELARALVERGDHARAVEVCRLGLEHHPTSILGRVTWGRALLLAGDARAAQDQLEIAIGIDPANPYAYNLVGEALVRAGLCREALPILTRAVELQPADPKARAALDEARRRAGGGTVTSMPALVAPATGPVGAAAPGPSATPAPAPTAVPTPARAAPPPAGGATRLDLRAVMTPAAAAGPPGEPGPTGPEIEHTDRFMPAEPSRDADRTEELTLKLSLGPLEEEDEEEDEEEQVSLGILDEVEDEPPPGAPAEAAPAAPPAPPPALQRAGKRGPPGPRTLLTMIPPGGPGPAPGAAPAVAPPAATDAADATRVALAYEQELREKAAQAEAQAPQPSRRGRTAVVAAALLAVVGAAAGAYFYVDGKARTQAAQGVVALSRAGLARDTKASLEEAAKVLAATLERPPSGADLRGQLASLQAQVAALLAYEHGDAAQRELARRLADDAAAGDGGLVARLLLAERPADRAVAEATVLASRPGDAPLLQRLAGQLLVARGEVESGRGRLRIAAESKPPLLGALTDLADSYLVAGDPEAALPLYEQAIAAHATHPRAVLGAAEARLALDRPIDGSRQELLAVENDAGSRPPLQSRLRWELTYARVLARSGDALAASRRLTLAAGALGESAALEGARAGLLLDARAFEQAEEAAARAVRLDPRSAELRVTLARARLGLHRHAAALSALQGVDGRGVWLVRGVALAETGQYAQARAALEKTARGGKLTPEAATWFALCELGQGRTEQALALLEKLAAARSADALVLAAHGRALAAARRFDEAEAACRRAVERDGGSPEGPLCLGRVLLAAGKAEAAVEPLTRAVALDRNDPEASRLLAAARAPRPPPPKKAPVKPVFRKR